MNKLQAYDVDPTRITVSGLSAGGFMAHQLHIAYSDVFKGAGLIGSGPYYCAENSLGRAVSIGMRARQIADIARLTGIIRELEEHGAIAPTRNLTQHRAWMFWGKNDTVINKPVVDSLFALYQHYIPKENLRYVDDVVAPHAMVTDHYGLTSTTAQESPYINNCGYDCAGELLNHLYGKLKPRTDDVRPVEVFDQEEFLQGATWHSLDTLGLVYVPTAARKGKTCGIHVALHGCEQHFGTIGAAFAECSGYNQWAEANNLIVLYPQARAQVSFMVFNPKGSFDWWGYDDYQYHTRAGRQMRAIVKMVNRLAGGILPV